MLSLGLAVAQRVGRRVPPWPSASRLRARWAPAPGAWRLAPPSLLRPRGVLLLACSARCAWVRCPALRCCRPPCGVLPLPLPAPRPLRGSGRARGSVSGPAGPHRRSGGGSPGVLVRLPTAVQPRASIVAAPARVWPGRSAALALAAALFLARGLTSAPSCAILFVRGSSRALRRSTAFRVRRCPWGEIKKSVRKGGLLFLPSGRPSDPPFSAFSRTTGPPARAGFP